MTPHVDLHAFADGVAVVSLRSTVVMDMYPPIRTRDRRPHQLVHGAGVAEARGRVVPQSSREVGMVARHRGARRRSGGGRDGVRRRRCRETRVQDERDASRDARGRSRAEGARVTVGSFRRRRRGQIPAEVVGRHVTLRVLAAARTSQNLLPKTWLPEGLVRPLRAHGHAGMSTFSALRCGVRVDRSAQTPSLGLRPGATRRRVAGWREDSPLAPPDGASKKKSKRDKRKGAATPRVEGGGKGEVDGAELNTIDLGQGKSAALYVPTNVAEVEGAVSAEGVKQLLARYKDPSRRRRRGVARVDRPRPTHRALPVPRQRQGRDRDRQRARALRVRRGGGGREPGGDDRRGRRHAQTRRRVVRGGKRIRRTSRP